MEDDAVQLIERFRQGDEEAARTLFQRHAGPLIAIVRGRMSARIGRRLDAEDVVLSAFSSFFGHVRQGRYTFEQCGDLWHLLVAISLNKLRQKIEFHSAAKRRYDLEQSQSPQVERHDVRFEAAAREPNPAAALDMLEEIERLTAGMDDVQRRIVELRLQGYELEEIAGNVSRSERTVRRVMEKVKTRLNERLLESSRC